MSLSPSIRKPSEAIYRGEIKKFYAHDAQQTSLKKDKANMLSVYQVVKQNPDPAMRTIEEKQMIRDFLKQGFPFSEFDGYIVEDIAGKLLTMKFPKKAEIKGKNSRLDNIFIIASGQVGVNFDCSGGKERTQLYKLKEHDILSESTFHDVTPWNSIVVALTEVKGLTIKREDYDDII